MAKPKVPRYTTPKGVAQYPYLNNPDTKFNPDGDYKVTLVLSAEDSNAITQFLDEQLALSVAEATKANPGKKIKTADVPYRLNEETGEVSINFKLKAKVTPQKGEPFEQKPAIFDAKGVPLRDVNVGGGSKIKVSYEVYPFYTSLIGAGITLRLKAAQVIDLVEYNGGSNSADYGFGKEEGYEGEEASPFVANEEANEEDF